MYLVLTIFYSYLKSKGLRPDAMCPCAASAEGLTVSIRRPGQEGANATGRGVLSMSGLSHGVVRVDQENSLTSLTLQDCGQVLPGGKRISFWGVAMSCCVATRVRTTMCLF